jgi:AcrR family transcriptional regulator
MTTHNPDDLRVRKTRRSLQQGLVRLILRQGYDSISLQDIADEAETARVTFYRHYRDKEELLTDCLNALYDDLAQRTQRLSPQMLLSGLSPIHTFYEHIVEHETLYQILFSSRGSQTVIQRLRHYMANYALTTLGSLGHVVVGNIPLDILAHHAASAQIGLAIWWLDQGKPYPAEYMARIAQWLSLHGTLGAIGAIEPKMPPPSLP